MPPWAAPHHRPPTRPNHPCVRQPFDTLQTHQSGSEAAPPSRGRLRGDSVPALLGRRPAPEGRPKNSKNSKNSQNLYLFEKKQSEESLAPVPGTEKQSGSDPLRPGRAGTESPRSRPLDGGAASDPDRCVSQCAEGLSDAMVDGSSGWTVKGGRPQGHRVLTDRFSVPGTGAR